jgi:hypothetical protein
MVKTRRMKRVRKATRKAKLRKQKGGMDLLTVEVKTRKSNGDYVSPDDVATLSSA